MTTVNIVTSDRGWILERLAREIASRLPYVTFGDGPDRAAAIQYYMTYSCRRRRLSPVELAYFAHLEPEGTAHDAFFATASAVDHCVTHARLYEAVLREAGVAEVTTIPPGVDLDAFRPKLRIGVVGRTYHTGRKGEHLVEQVMDIPEIEWRFTGPGWPGPALDLPPEAMPEFYRGLDYVLVPALYEGGPMCVVEALASGTEVIAPPVGWVPEFPHIEYRAGDAADLRRVLLGLVETKRALRASVLGHGWDAWAEGHDRLFRRLAGERGIELRPPQPAARRSLPRRVGLFLHGSEAASQGGPSVRAPRLAEELAAEGIAAELRRHPDPAGLAELDLVHVFNTWPIWSAPDLIRRARRAGRALVLSPILLDHGLRDLWEDRLLEVFDGAAPGPALDAALAAFRATLASRRAAASAAEEPAPGFTAAVREMAALADRLILLGEAERARLAGLGARTDHARVVINPVDAARFAAADPALFEQETGLTDFVLCVARLEPRKNQLMLAHALRGTGLPLVLIGHGDHRAYRDLLERHRTPDLHILDRLPPDSPLLASAYAAARVFVLPSWSEGTPLVALEAAAAGARLVLSAESGAAEHLGDIARSCDAGDPASIRRAVLDAWDWRRDPAEVAAQKALVAERFGWDQHRAATVAVYAEALAAAEARGAAPPRPLPVPPAAPAEGRPVPLVMDVTTTANHRGRWTGIARVEAALAEALLADQRAEIRFVAWNNTARSFVEVPREAVRARKVAPLLAQHDADPLPPAALPEGAHLLVAGSAWMQNALYAENLVALARRHRLRLAPLIHDVIPTRFPFWFDAGYAPVFEHNLTLLLDAAETLIAVSQATRREIEGFALRTPGLLLPEAGVVREGDELPAAEAEGVAPGITASLAGVPFVLSVGAIHARKNQRLLYDVWLMLAERMGPRCPHLVIVGGVAWNGADVARALTGDARLAGRVHILEDVDDAALLWLYRNCLFTVYPSLHEGWGLPVAESLRLGKPCLAADVASIPEIAPGLVELIDPRDTARWAARVQFLATSRAAREAAAARIAAGYAGTSWATTAEQVLDHLATVPPRPPRAYTPGTVVELADRIAAARHRGAGWHAVEPWGCWASATTADLLFEPALPIGEAALLILEARALPFPGTALEVRIRAEGEQVASWRLGDATPQVLHAIIPARLAADAARLRITIESDALVPVRQVAGGDDPRLVGLGVARAALAPLSTVRDTARHLGGALPVPRRLPLGCRHDLLAEEAGHAVLHGAWSARPGWGMVPAGARPRLDLVLTERPGDDLEIALRLRPVATAAAPLLLVALAEGEQVGSWTFASDAPVSLTIPLPAALRGRVCPLTLDLLPADPQAPAALGLGASGEPFGFGLLALAVHAAGTPPALPRLPLAEGAALEFGTAAGHAGAPGPDWHAPDPEGVWSSGPSALLPLRLPPEAREGMLLTATLEAFGAAPGAAKARLVASAGGAELSRHAMPPRQRRSLAIPVPPGLCGPGGELDLLLAVEAASSPFAAGEGADERPLGIRLLQLAAAPLPAGAPELVHDFSTSGDTAALGLTGWYSAEPEGRWCEAAGAEIRLTRPPGAGSHLRLVLSGRVFGTGFAGPARVDLLQGGAVAAFLVFEHDGFVTHHVGIATDPAASEVVLTLRRPGAVSPAEAGEGSDARRLGVMLRTLAVLWE